ncbi:hypothetical protein V9T40_000522 [Parthenolecanium corni]|uniref:G-protein coupled receptors family 1 profile domain-containing protein n=1 Tax=Parthenolecanium corni TaxID=536013 RepID=A0AAN9T9H6_9HEMI
MYNCGQFSNDSRDTTVKYNYTFTSVSDYGIVLSNHSTFLADYLDAVVIFCLSGKRTPMVGSESATVQFADWLNNENVLNAYFIIYYSFRVIFVHVGPCISLVILNLLLFRAMRKAQLKRDKLFKENRKSECKKLRDSNCTTLMLIVVVTVFLLTEIPLAVVTVLHIISSGFTEILDYDIVNTLILFTNFFIIVSYPINFAIYCGMSRQFRETFKELFIRGTVPVTRRNGGSSKYSLVNGPRTCTNETVL